ncbi:MAG: hypothetical protein IKO03_08495 [Lachnospiraceae bacterium]|nr:hypothetical protein [Lachnospiraceae bacterium]MBR4608376.1 hypothetical protein [Lachnospiraceae bacterium]
MDDNLVKILKMNWNKNSVNKTVCIISFNDDEMRTIINKYNLQHKKDDHEYYFWMGSLEKENQCWLISCYQPLQTGNNYAQQIVPYLFTKDFDYYFVIGTAGAMGAKLYDVIIVKDAIYLGKGENNKSGILHDMQTKSITPKMINKINTFILSEMNKDHNYELYFAPVYNSNNVEKNPEDKDIVMIKENIRKTKAVEMEAYAIFLSEEWANNYGSKLKNPVIMIRGVSDRADDKKGETYEDKISADKRKQIAVLNSLDVMEDYLLFCD